MIRATWGARRRALGVPLRLGRASAPREGHSALRIACAILQRSTSTRPLHEPGAVPFGPAHQQKEPHRGVHSEERGDHLRSHQRFRVWRCVPGSQKDNDQRYTRNNLDNRSRGRAAQIIARLSRATVAACQRFRRKCVVAKWTLGHGGDLLCRAQSERAVRRSANICCSPGHKVPLPSSANVRVLNAIASSRRCRDRQSRPRTQPARRAQSMAARRAPARSRR